MTCPVTQTPRVTGTIRVDTVIFTPRYDWSSAAVFFRYGVSLVRLVVSWNAMVHGWVSMWSMRGALSFQPLPEVTGPMVAAWPRAGEPMTAAAARTTAVAADDMARVFIGCLPE